MGTVWQSLLRCACQHTGSRHIIDNCFNDADTVAHNELGVGKAGLGFPCAATLTTATMTQTAWST